jgi:hypothetical protein
MMNEDRDINSVTLRALPQTIWMPASPGAEPSVYHGSPAEMVASMAEEMGDGVGVREAVDRLCAALALYRRVVIGLPEDVTDDRLAQLFVFALLDTGMAKPMADA